MSKAISIDDLPDEVRGRIIADAGIKPVKQHSMKMDEVRSKSILVLQPIAGLSKSDRNRVLKHALKMNEL